jgi:phosphoesterase RecJ-like protein
MQFSSKILERMTMDGEILSSRYTRPELQQADLHPDEADLALHTMTEIEGGELVIFAKQTPTEIRISLRGKGKYDCNAIAQSFGGGGHFNAAGCTIPYSSTVPEAVNAFLQQVKTMI